MEIWAVLLVIYAHFVGDFFCQSQKMAENKSKHLSALIIHSVIYGAVVFLITIPVFMSLEDSSFWFLINTFCHFIVDFVSSKFYYIFVRADGGFKRKFFNGLAVDQMIHITILFSTIGLIQ